jgi:hypothetical protein
MDLVDRNAAAPVYSPHHLLVTRRRRARGKSARHLRHLRMHVADHNRTALLKAWKRTPSALNISERVTESHNPPMPTSATVAPCHKRAPDETGGSRAATRRPQAAILSRSSCANDRS